jgi:hypothetical protein
MPLHSDDAIVGIVVCVVVDTGSAVYITGAVMVNDSSSQ